MPRAALSPLRQDAMPLPPRPLSFRHAAVATLPASWPLFS